MKIANECVFCCYQLASGFFHDYGVVTTIIGYRAMAIWTPTRSSTTIPVRDHLILYIAHYILTDRYLLLDRISRLNPHIGPLYTYVYRIIKECWLISARAGARTPALTQPLNCQLKKIRTGVYNYVEMTVLVALAMSVKTSLWCGWVTVISCGFFRLLFFFFYIFNDRFAYTRVLPVVWNTNLPYVRLPVQYWFPKRLLALLIDPQV